jgi:putative salt-induced outer membrane protein YdiY
LLALRTKRNIMFAPLSSHYDHAAKHYKYGNGEWINERYQNFDMHKKAFVSDSVNRRVLRENRRGMQPNPSRHPLCYADSLTLLP